MVGRSVATEPVGEAVRRAVDVLDAGGLVVFPSETVYGIAARVDRPEALSRLRDLAGVGPEHRFAWHVADAKAAEGCLESPGGSLRRFLHKVMPGPVTLRVKQPGGWVALRCPDHDLTRSLLASTGGRVVGTSVRAPDGRAVVEASAAAAVLGDAVDEVLDGGTSRFGRPSTLVEVTESDGRLELNVRRSGVIDERMLKKMTRFNLLLVCTGNTCRSPMAEAIARQLLKDRSDVTIASAGVYAAEGSPASMEAIDAARSLGIDLTDHRSRPLGRDLINAADRIYTMTESHRQAVLTQSPDAAAKVQRLDPAGDIADPIGQPLAVYEQTAAQIRKALVSRLKEQQL